MKKTQLWVQLYPVERGSQQPGVKSEEHLDGTADDSAHILARWCLFAGSLQALQQDLQHGSLEQLAGWLQARQLPDAGGLHTVLLMCGDTLVTRQLSFQAKEKKHLQRLLPFMLEPELAADLSHVHVAHGKQRVLADEGRVSVAYTNKKSLQSAIQILENMGLELEEIYALPAALPTSQGAWTLLLDRDLCHLHADGLLCASVEPGLVLPLIDAVLAGPQFAQTDTELTVLVSAADIHSPTLLQLYPSLSEHLGLTQAGITVTQQVIPHVWSRLMLQGDDLVNLRQGELAAPLRVAKYWKPLRTPLIAAMVAICVVIGSVFVETRINQHRFEALENQAEQRYRDVMPDGMLVDAVQQLTTQLSRYRAAGSSSGPVALLNAMLETFESAEGLNLHRLSYSINDQNTPELHMTISAPTTADILAINEQLSTKGWTAQAQNISRAGDVQQANLIVRGNGL